MTHTQLRMLVKEIVHDTLTSMGLETDRPLEMQRDMASIREIRLLLADPALQADLLHLRKWREAMELAKKRSIISMATMVAAGIVAALTIGVKEIFMR